jgi:hypothetical protein
LVNFLQNRLNWWKVILRMISQYYSTLLVRDWRTMFSNSHQQEEVVTWLLQTPSVLFVKPYTVTINKWWRVWMTNKILQMLQKLLKTLFIYFWQFVDMLLPESRETRLLLIVAVCHQVYANDLKKRCWTKSFS